MAHVTLTDGRELDVPDSDTSLLDYYRGEGATIDAKTVLIPPYSIDENGQVVEPPVVTEAESTDPGAGEELHGIEHPADGNWSPEISDDPAHVSDPLDLH